MPPSNQPVGIDLASLVGQVGAFYGAHSNVFRFGDRFLEVVENEEDGYRSSLDYVVEIRDPGGFFSEPIATVRVEVDESSDEIYRVVDVQTGHVWLEFGTANADDYYPMFVFDYRVPGREEAAPEPPVASGSPVTSTDVAALTRAIYGRDMAGNAGDLERGLEAWSAAHRTNMTFFGRDRNVGSLLNEPPDNQNAEVWRPAPEEPTITAVDAGPGVTWARQEDGTYRELPKVEEGPLRTRFEMLLGDE